MTDHDGMRCDQWREVLSARLDGEETPEERDGVDAHLATCPECSEWWDTAGDITRLARTSPASLIPPVPDTVLDAVPGRWRARLATALHVVLGTLGALQLGLGMVQVSGSTTATNYLHTGHLTDATHLWHESASWNLAIGAGFLWIATRRGRPTGALPILTAFVAALLLLSAADLIAGRVDPARLVSHAFLVTGYAVIVALTRPALDFGQPPTGPHRRTWRWRVHFDTDDEAVPTRPAPPTTARPVDGTTHHAA